MEKTWEGSWEEIVARGDELSGHRVRVTILDVALNGESATNGVGSEAPPRVALHEIAYRFPDNPDAPRDGAAQLEHYLYGMPKNPDNEVE